MSHNSQEKSQNHESVLTYLKMNRKIYLLNNIINILNVTALTG